MFPDLLDIFITRKTQLTNHFKLSEHVITREKRLVLANKTTYSDGYLERFDLNYDLIDSQKTKKQLNDEGEKFEVDQYGTTL